MKKIISKLKGKKVLSLVLAAIMFVTTFSVAVPMLKLDASAAGIGGITQERVVGTDGSYVATYESYADSFLNGAGEPTDIVIPGLNVSSDGTETEYQENDFVIQGLSYYPKQDWIMVSAYHNDGKLPSMIFALDAKSGNFVYAFAIYNSDGTTPNMDHGGGLAFSKYNFYYSGDDSDLEDGDDLDDANCIAYAPVTQFDPENHVDSDYAGIKKIVLKGQVSLPEMGGAATAYVCYDEGILWAGNFFENDTGGGDYSNPVIPEDSAAGVALQNSMIYGYNLQGNSSEEEWAYLAGKTQNDCAGRPSHCITVHTDYEDIQYAVVDNGKLYLSRSWGTGVNDEWFATTVIGGWIASLDDYSTLTVGDIDLSTEGTEKIQYKTTDGSYVTTYAHRIDASNTKHFEMMPMSEGLCFIDGDLYISFEGASNKYMNEYAWQLSGSSLTKTGNCDYPIDVVWHVDPYKLLEEERAEISNAIKFKKVTSLSEIKDDKEYIIVYESPEKNPVNQKNILYAFDACGNFKNLRLSKSTNTKKVGYDGMIGHAISDYSIENGTLYLRNAEDDLASMRWKIIDANAGKLRIQSQLPYYSSNRNFYFDADTISMINDTGIADDPLTLEAVGDGDTGKFYLKNDGSYLWCNDFSVDGYKDAADTWYKANSNTQIYAGINEKKGTFHTDALNSNGNIIGKSIDTTKNDYLRQISIYECETDEFSSTEKNRVYTDMNAELQSDGTYTVNLETYATSALHYKASNVEKPTDFIFVLDASASMREGDGTGMIPYPGGDLAPYSIAGEKKIADYDVVSTYKITHKDGAVGSSDIYMLINGEYIKVYLETSPLENNNRQYMWMYGTYRGETWYWNPNTTAGNVTVASDGGRWQNTKPEKNDTIIVEGGNTRERGKHVIYLGDHYRYTTKDHHNAAGTSGRYVTMQETACNIIDEVAADASASKLGHRFAVTQYGATNGFYPSGSSSINTGTDYSNAFWSATDGNQVSELKKAINSVSPPSAPSVGKTTTVTAGNEFTNANGIIEANKGTYSKTDSNGRNVAVIFISDGLAGTDSIRTDDGGWFSDDKIVITPGGTKTEANKVISQAKTAKENGAFIYSILIGHGSVSDYKKEDYMKAVSSQLPGASNLDELGGECAELVSYSINLSESSALQFITYVDKLVKDVKTNDSVAIEKLEAETVIVEQLSDAFIIPNEYNYDVEFYKGYYDCLDRFQFVSDASPTTGVKAEVKTQVGTDGKEEKWLVITGYNYSQQYVARNHDGNKLKVSIRGLLANPKADITNTSINNTDTTAIYKTSTSADPFKKFPTEYFSIPEYTYVLDYGLDMLDTNVNGTLCAVSNAPTKQNVADYKAKVEYTQKSANGLVKITNESQDLLYHTTPTNMNDSGYCLIQREDGTYDWFEIKVVPASNVYFEESEFATTEGTGTVAWGEATGGTSASHRDLPKELDVDGYDEAYNNTNTYSNGKTLSASVDAANKRSKTATVNFKGDGIDIISACGPTTGLQIINIKDAETGKSVKAGIVDTYYSGGSFTQVPVFSWRGDYGTYTVESTAVYLSTAGALQSSKIVNKLVDIGLVKKSSKVFNTAKVQEMLDEAGIEDIAAKDVELIWHDDNSILNGGTGVAPTKKGTRATTATSSVTLNNYLDGFRIYNPLGADSDSYTESEKNASYVNVINNLAPVENGKDTLDGIGFITGTLGEGETNLNFSNYQSVGPKDEFYLLGSSTETKAVTFKTKVNIGEKVMLGLRAVNGPTTVNITSDKSSEIVQITVNSATEMFYDISNCIGDITADNTEVQVIIQNAGDKMLAVNQVKFSGGAKVNSGNSRAARFLARTVNAITEVFEDDFLPLTAEDLTEVEISLTEKETVKGEVKNGVVVPVDEEIPEDNTNTDNTNPDNENTNTDNENTNDGTDTEGSEEEFDISSLIRMFIKMIETIIKTAFGAGNIA